MEEVAKNKNLIIYSYTENLINFIYAGGATMSDSEISAIPTTNTNEKDVKSSLEIVYISRSDLTPDPEQVRKQFSHEHINRLKDSFKQIGVRTPLDVVLLDKAVEGSSHYMIVDGECRYRASEGLLDELPCIIHKNNETAVEWALSANLMRDDLNPIEKSDVLVRFMEKNNGAKKIKLEDAAKKYHLSKSMISEYYSLSKLSKEIKEEQRRTGQIPLRELKKLSVKKLRDNQEELLKRYNELKEKYPTEEERIEAEKARKQAEDKKKTEAPDAPNTPNKRRAKHIEGMKTRPQADYKYYSDVKLELEAKKFSEDELMAVYDNLEQAANQYKEIIEIIKGVTNSIEDKLKINEGEIH